MRTVLRRSVFLVPALLFTIAVIAQAQRNTAAVQQNTAQTSPSSASTSPAPAPLSGPRTILETSDEGGDNPYDPLLEPPPLPKGPTTLLGGIATSVDHVRNHITIKPFGGGRKIKVLVDERSHIYRNGRPTTILGVRRGDRVYVDTMLDGDKVLARNVRVLTETGMAEVRGQVIGVNPEKGTINVRDQLSARQVTFAVSKDTRYNSSTGAATAAEVQPGALIDVQFAPRRDTRDVAEEIVVLAKPGDNYIFSGVVTNLDMRTNSLFLDNQSDDRNYQLHFSPVALDNAHALRVGQQVTARAIFDGKQYQVSSIRIASPKPEQGQEPKAH
ncbi:MAG TPA: DUF5666 domain-containing protein [Terriglobales bacterium]|nr:DUF5666 domain-containing protein [Terriglobales bacterium]